MISYIIPTLGQRRSINNTIQSLLDSSLVTKIYIVGPQTSILNVFEIRDEENRIEIIDFNGNLPSAVNFGLKELKSKYWNWISDDDMVDASGLATLVESLESEADASFGFGRCVYINNEEYVIATNFALKGTLTLMKYGPNFVSQPSCLFKKDIALTVQGLNESYKYAFDQEFILKIMRLKLSVVRTNEVVAKYRWDINSLTASNEIASLEESYNIRLAYATTQIGKIIVKLLKNPTCVAVKLAHRKFTKRLHAISYPSKAL